jgi:tetratricopeptide (TPR) repeat protein
MTTRFRCLALSALLLAGVAFGAPAQAQAPRFNPPGAERTLPVQPPSDVPRAPRGDAAAVDIDRLFAALKVAPTPESAKYIEGKIWAVWAAAGGDTAMLLMSRAKTAMDGKDVNLALRLLTAAIDVKPDYAEAWNRRATLHFIRKEYGAAMADLRAVLAREPRHFGAWAGLGMILHEIGEDKRALDALRRAVALHPHLEKIPDLVKRLTEQVEGRDI